MWKSIGWGRLAAISLVFGMAGCAEQEQRIAALEEENATLAKELQQCRAEHKSAQTAFERCQLDLEASKSTLDAVKQEMVKITETALASNAETAKHHVGVALVVRETLD